MFELTLHLVGGQSVKIEVNDFETRTRNNELTGITYDFADRDKHRLSYTRLDHVSAIEVRPLPTP